MMARAFGMAMALAAVAGTTGAGDAGWMAADHGFNQPTFRVTTDGPQGNTTLNEIEFPGGWRYDKFIFASDVTGFELEGNANYTRVVLGPNASGEAPRKAGGGSSSMSASSTAAFEDAIRGTLQNTNLNNFVDNQGSGQNFQFTLELEKPLKDNDPDLDEVGEIIFFERGSSTANSFLVLEALDADGNVIGNPVLVHPDEPVSCTPAAHVGTYNIDLSYKGTQEMGGVSVDLTRFGVASLQRLRIKRATVGENGLTSEMVTGGRDINPDFKLVFVQTYDLSVPAWFMGD